MGTQKATASSMLPPLPVAQSLGLAMSPIRLAVRIASVMCAFWLGVVRIIFLCGFKLARGITQGVASRYARQPASQTQSPSSKDTDKAPEKREMFLYHGLAASWARSGFCIRASRPRTAAFDWSGAIGLLDQLYRSLDSTRNVVSAITTIRRNICKSNARRDSVEWDDTVTKGEQVNLMDPILALAVFAYLQHACQDTEQETARRLALEETILDAVIRDGTPEDEQVKQELDAAWSPPTSSSTAEDDDAFASRRNSQVEDSPPYHDDGPKAAESTDDDGREVDSLVDAALEKKRQRKGSTAQDYAKPTASSSRRKEITVHPKRASSTRTHTPRSSQDSSRRSRPSSVEMSIDESSLKRIGQALLSQTDSRPSTNRAKTATSNSRLEEKIRSNSRSLPIQVENHPPDLSPRETSQEACGSPGSLESEGSIGCSASKRTILIDLARYVRFVSRLHQKLVAPRTTSRDETGQGQGEEYARDAASGSCVSLAASETSLGGDSLSGSAHPRTQLAYSVSLDHEAGAVVLACSGTGESEDVLAALAGESSKLAWQGHMFKVHRAAHSAACRLLCGRQSVLAALGRALAEFPGYGLVLCGHSFGAGVAAVLGVLLSEPSSTGPGLVTRAWPYARRNSSPVDDEERSHPGLPAGRRVHVYAYGPPGVMCASLRRLTRDLITTLVHGDDVMPCLSRELADQLRSLGRSWRDDENGMRTTTRQHALGALRGVVLRGWWPFRPQMESLGGGREEGWTVPVLETMRASMRGRGRTLLPPGEVFTLEVEGPESDPGGEQRVVFKHVRRVEDRFREIRFARGMLSDHDLAGYEHALAVSRRT